MSVSVVGSKWGGVQRPLRAVVGVLGSMLESFAGLVMSEVSVDEQKLFEASLANET